MACDVTCQKRASCALVYPQLVPCHVPAFRCSWCDAMWVHAVMRCGYMQVLMDEGGEELLSFTTPTNGDTCLFSAAKEGHVDVVQVPPSPPSMWWPSRP